MATVKRKNVMSMEEEDKAFFEAAMKDPKIRKQIEEDEKKRDHLFREQSKRLIESKKKKTAKE